jgi:hypothetical protein
MSRFHILADLSRQPFVRLLFVLWAASGAWDLVLSEWIPEEYAKRLPRVYQVIAMTTGLLSWQIWIVAGALIFAFACLEYAVRRARAADWPSPNMASHAAPNFNYTPAISADNRTIVDPEYIVKLCRDKTDLQVRAITSPYIGKTLTITGRVTKVRDRMPQKEIHVELACADDVNIEAHFRSDDLTVLTQVTIGTIVTVQGYFYGIQYGGAIIIIRCTVLQIPKT